MLFSLVGKFCKRRVLHGFIANCTEYAVRMGTFGTPACLYLYLLFTHIIPKGWARTLSVPGGVGDLATTVPRLEVAAVSGRAHNVIVEVIRNFLRSTVEREVVTDRDRAESAQQLVHPLSLLLGACIDDVRQFGRLPFLVVDLSPGIHNALQFLDLRTQILLGWTYTYICSDVSSTDAELSLAPGTCAHTRIPREDDCVSVSLDIAHAGCGLCPGVSTIPIARKPACTQRGQVLLQCSRPEGSLVPEYLLPLLLAVK